MPSGRRGIGCAIRGTTSLFGSRRAKGIQSGSRKGIRKRHRHVFFIEAHPLSGVPRCWQTRVNVMMHTAREVVARGIAARQYAAP